jgi:hypothetical protein
MNLTLPFLFEIAKRIVTTLELKLEVKESDFENSYASFNFKEKFIPALCGELGEKGQLVLLFDEFDVLGEIEDTEGDFIPFMVSLIEEIQIKKYPLKFIFAVGCNYKDLDRQWFGRITKSGPQQEISNFTLEETKKLLKNSSDGIIPFDEEAIREVHMLTSGHPYFTQCLAASSFDAAEKNKAPRVTREIVRRQLIPAIKRYSSGVYWFWDSLPTGDQVVLYLMAVLKEETRPITLKTIREKAVSLKAVHDIENFRQILERMVRFRLIRNDKQGEYDFYVEFFRKWIVKEISEAEIKKSIEQITIEELHRYTSSSKTSWAEAVSNDRKERF